MKTMTSLLLALFASSSVFAMSKELTVAKCDATIVIDEGETARIGMHVVRLQGDMYAAYLIGSSLPENELQPVEELAILSPADAWKKNGVAHIAMAAGLSKEDFDKLSRVNVFTSGNFDDDAAGVRLAEFVDADGVINVSGMFFGWAGPQKCD